MTSTFSRFKKLMDHRTRRPVTRIQHHLDAAAEIELRREFIQVSRDHVHRMVRAVAGGEIAGLDQAADVLNGLTMQRAARRTRS